MRKEVRRMNYDIKMEEQIKKIVDSAMSKIEDAKDANILNDLEL